MNVLSADGVLPLWCFSQFLSGHCSFLSHVPNGQDLPHGAARGGLSVMQYSDILVEDLIESNSSCFLWTLTDVGTVSNYMFECKYKLWR